LARAAGVALCTINYPEALKWFSRAAAQGDADAQNNLGVIFTQGDGIAVNYPEALKWFFKAATQGNAKAQYNLGVMYEFGQGVEVNYIKAYQFISIASELGYGEAVEALEGLTDLMTPEQIAQAQSEAALMREKIQK
jgi:uncharacterized protein